ncbi:MAG: PilZ domain-containing protein [Archangium sp.]|nr:PilZ domain-containing protein [Archangium sp.]
MFGPVTPSQQGFTQDISETGLFITTTLLPKVGTRLMVQLESPTKKSSIVMGEVVRHVIVPPELRSVMRHGFGVKLISDRALVRSLMEAEKPVPAGPSITFHTPAEYQRVKAEELSKGCLSFTSPKAVAINDEVEVAISCAWRQGVLTLRGRTVLARDVAGACHAVLVLNDPAKATSALEGFTSQS